MNQLVAHNIIDTKQAHELNEIKNHFDIRVPQSYLNEIKDNNEVLKKQFIPSSNELVFFPEELEDPIGDEIWSPVEGITHRYPDRVLLKPTYMCAAYCRFCFRRYKVSHTEYNLKEEAYQKALEYIKLNSQIEEVILTGGDPLTLTDTILGKILIDLANIEHIKVLRFHTRVPSLLPSRITQNLVTLLKNTKKSVWVAAHINHHDEFKPETKKALALFIDNGIPVLLQSVLLKGVNDSTENLIQLFKAAVENRVKPYYLHYPDLAKGTKHFRIPLREAILLVKSLRGKISGLCIPHFILDIPGGKGKIEINPHYSREISAGLWQFESPRDGSITEIRYS
ncbi:MAG: KamA family radical SAM protein [Bdellovibrionota bacterium]